MLLLKFSISGWWNASVCRLWSMNSSLFLVLIPILMAKKSSSIFSNKSMSVDSIPMAYHLILLHQLMFCPAGLLLFTSSNTIFQPSVSRPRPSLRFWRAPPWGSCSSRCPALNFGTGAPETTPGWEELEDDVWYDGNMRRCGDGKNWKNWKMWRWEDLDFSQWEDEKMMRRCLIWWEYDGNIIHHGYDDRNMMVYPYSQWEYKPSINQWEYVDWDGGSLRFGKDMRFLSHKSQITGDGSNWGCSISGDGIWWEPRI
jgi:hypothetical protein